PLTFLGVGGINLFRDDIYGRLRTVFTAYHRAYQRLGWYKTFPHASFSTMLLNIFVAPLVNLPFIRPKFDKVIKVQMVRPLKQVVAKAPAAGYAPAPSAGIELAPAGGRAPVPSAGLR